MSDKIIDISGKQIKMILSIQMKEHYIG